jgi:tartrate dehydrogenase/decarboxylase/D-malate dehydrogenase
MMPADGIETLKKFDAIFLGAVGSPGVPDHISLWDLLLVIRKSFDQYINLTFYLYILLFHQYYIYMKH